MVNMEQVVPLLGEEWAKVLWEEFNKPYLLQTMSTIKKDRSKTKVYPPSDKVFRAYQLTPYSKVKVCIIGQDPYHTPGVADGLCFSTPDSIERPVPPSLVNIFKELDNDLKFEGHRNIAHSTDLSRWAEQGIMLLNTSLTVINRAPGSHSKIGWKRFTATTIHLLARRVGMVFVMWGNHAKSLKKVMHPMNNWFIESSHPSPFSAHKGFFGSKPFSKVNKCLIHEGLDPIQW